MKLFDAQPYMADILAITNEAIISVNQAQQIIVFNHGAERIFGYTATEVMGQPLDILLPQGLSTIHHQHIQAFATTDTPSRLMGERAEIMGRRKNGKSFPAEASISKLKIEDGLIFSVVLRDITDRRAAELEQEKLIIELKAINQAARDITSELVLEDVLQDIVQIVQTLLNVKYIALGVKNEAGHLSGFITAGLSATERAKIGDLPVGLGVLEIFLHQGKPLIINDIANHLAAVGFPEHHLPIQQLLGVPILSKGEVIGALYLADKVDGTPFTQVDQDLMERIVLHIAIAIENAHLYEKVQRLAVLEERDRFARDLHDGIIQSLYAVGLMLDLVKVDIADFNPDITKQLNISIKNIASVITDIRNYIFDLRPQALHNKGLKARLETLIQELSSNTNLTINCEVSSDIDQYVTDMQVSHLFHIIHEALSNVARHAKATEVTVKAIRQDQVITVLVEDNGIGFTPPTEILPGHYGLTNIQARAANLEAQLQLDSHPGGGTHLQLALSLSKSQSKPNP